MLSTHWRISVIYICAHTEYEQCWKINEYNRSFWLWYSMKLPHEYHSHSYSLSWTRFSERYKTLIFVYTHTHIYTFVLNIWFDIVTFESFGCIQTSNQCLNSHMGCTNYCYISVELRISRNRHANESVFMKFLLNAFIPLLFFFYINSSSHLFLFYFFVMSLHSQDPSFNSINLMSQRANSNAKMNVYCICREKRKSFG